jgi:hypothetical protein
VRVPALVVGPRVARGVCHRLFDHVTLIKTILPALRGRPGVGDSKDGAARRASASPRRRAGRRAAHGHTRARGGAERIDAWKLEAQASRRGTCVVGYSPVSDGAGRPFALHQFQEDFVRFALAMRAIGLPPGQP